MSDTPAFLTPHVIRTYLQAIADSDEPRLRALEILTGYTPEQITNLGGLP